MKQKKKIFETWDQVLKLVISTAMLLDYERFVAANEFGYNEVARFVVQKHCFDNLEKSLRI